jgi:threonine-phosphate decarboxylase
MSHGGNLAAVARQFGIAPDRILDFSANVNPYGLPPRAAERLAREAADPHLLAAYPDPDAGELRAALAAHLDVPPESIVIASGADALIHAVLRALAPRRCVIPQPAFSEYARAASANRGDGPDLLILNNPHNPTGACLSRAAMLERVAGISVLADEAFVDYVPEAAITRDAAARAGLVSIRSLTKFYGAPGLRAGYAVAEPATARAIAAQLPPWPVTTLALNAFAEALRDRDYARETIERNRRAREVLARDLAALGCEVLPSAANFLLVRVADAIGLRDLLIRHHAILVRECESFEGLERGRYLRIAVRRESENRCLVEALREILCRSTHA